MDNELTPEQSLKLIETMIGQAKRSFQRNSFYFLLWGVLLIAAMLVNYIMALRNNPNGGYAWAVMGVVGGISSWMYGARESKRVQASSPMDRIIMWLWVAFVITMLTTMFSGASSQQTMPVGAIIVLTGLPTFVTGQLLRFKPLILGGVLFWVLGAASYFVDMQGMVLLYIAAIFFGYLVPGYLLKRQEDGVRAA